MKVTHVHITRELEDQIRQQLEEYKADLPLLVAENRAYHRGFIAALQWVLQQSLDTTEINGTDITQETP